MKYRPGSNDYLHPYDFDIFHLFSKFLLFAGNTASHAPRKALLLLPGLARQELHTLPHFSLVF